MSKDFCCQEEMNIVKVGQPAPKFSGMSYADGEFKKISSDDYKGKWIVLFFYPLDFTFVCPTEITAYSKHMEDFAKRGAVVVGCSVDSEHSHRAWSEGSLGKINFPLLADITKKVSDDYGVLIEDEGIALRGTFIIDPHGVLKYQVVHDLNVGRSVDETLRVLDALQSGGLCAADWSAGEKFVEKR